MKRHHLNPEEFLNLNHKPIPGWEGIYSITECGNVFSHPRKGNPNGRFRVPVFSGKGYGQVTLSHPDRKVEEVAIHRLVAELFIPNPNGLPQVNHIDEDKKNNHASNLEWVTSKRNIEHSRATPLTVMIDCEELTLPSLSELSRIIGRSSTYIRQRLDRGEMEIDGVKIISAPTPRKRKGKILNIKATVIATGEVSYHGSIAEFARAFNFRYDMAWPLCNGDVSHHRGVKVEVTRK